MRFRLTIRPMPSSRHPRAHRSAPLSWALTASRSSTLWVIAALTVVSFLQRPTEVTFDTKLDLTVDPGGFLGRSLRLWDPLPTSGELKNQAYGYLFPMGPFFLLFDRLGVPAWITQRLWCALLLSVAFVGMTALTRAMRVGTDRSRLIGALAYTLAPRTLTEIGPLSAETLPAVLLPWVLLPLVRAGRIGSPRRAACLSALGVFAMGGINGSMVVMALVLPVLWLATRRWTREHVRLVAWWTGGVLVATLWWLGPLSLLGEYSLPFLDYIESATNTTAPLSLFEVLRGTNQWVAYVVSGRPWWPAGWLLVDNPVLMIATGLVAALGLYGLARPGLPHRRFLILGTLTGLALLTVGHVGTLDSPVAEPVRNLLDGPLAPLRNVHKFEPVLRLPLTVALCFAVGERGVGRVWRPVTAGVLVLAMAAPAWTLILRPGPGWPEIPGYWTQAVRWVNDAGGRVLLLPATGFGEYTWGRTVDEPIQALTTGPWAVRNLVPLGSEGNTRVMDTVTQAVENGRGEPRLADFLARSGYRFLLVRNDIDRTAGPGPPPVAVLRAGLAGSEGISRVAEFGPPVDVGAPSGSVPSVEVYEVRRDVERVSTVSTTDVVNLSGGPESTLSVLDSGWLAPDAPSVLAGDGAGTSGRRVVTDGLRRRERDVSVVRNGLSQTLTATETSRRDRPSLDVLPFEGVEHQTVAVYEGIRDVRASSAASYADAAGVIDRSRMPFAALDGDPGTFWQSSGFDGPVGQWLEVELGEARPVTEVELRFVDDLRVGWPVTRIRLTTDNGSRDVDVPSGGGAHRYPVPPGLTRTVRVTVLSLVVGRRDGNAGIAELSVPGVNPSRWLRVPHDQPGAPDFAFSADIDSRYACVAEPFWCAERLDRRGEEPGGMRRLFTVDTEVEHRISGRVLPRRTAPPPIRSPEVTVTDTSRLRGDPAAGGWAAIDGDPATTWIPDVTDVRPGLSMSWSRPREITAITVATSATSGAARPDALILTTPTETRTLTLDEEGRARFPPLRTDQLTLVIPLSDREDVGAPPRGIGALTVDGLADVLDSAGARTPFEVPCGEGPRIRVDDTVVDTSVRGTWADITAHRPLPFTVCGSATVSLAPGEHRLVAEPGRSFEVRDLWLGRDGRSPAGAAGRRETVIRDWGSTSRSVEVGPGEQAVLSVTENANPGWTATMDDAPLTRTRVDGWRQAWVVPAGDGGTVRLTFEPDRRYRMSLMLGALAVVVLLIATAWPVTGRRRFSVAGGGAPVVVGAVTAGLCALIGGLPAVIALVGCVIIHRRRPLASAWLAVSGMVVSTVIATAGRVAGHGQDWAYGAGGQGPLLITIAAIGATLVHIPRSTAHRARHRRPPGDHGLNGVPGWSAGDPD